MPPEVARAIEHERRTVWSVPIHFQIALAQLPTDAAHLIYSQTGNDLNLDDERFDFMDGLFLGSPSGGVTVLAVENGSKSDKAGIKAGDQILSVNGRLVPQDLGAFPNVYIAARKDAEDSRATSFPVVVRSTGEAGSHTVNVATPATIKSMLMEGL
jgi:C-terminal processing protease CtpA/Prc